MALQTVSEIKSTWLNIGDNSQDTRLLSLIGAAARIIKGICKQPIDAESIQIDFVGTGNQTHMLPYTVPVTLTSLQYKETVDAATWQTATGAIIFKADGITHLYYEPGLNAVLWRINVTIGYDGTTHVVPDDIKEVCAEMVIEMFKMTDYGGRESRFGVNSIANSEGGTTQTTQYRDLTARFRNRLAPYVLRAY